jgi:hypothetical protein
MAPQIGDAREESNVRATSPCSAEAPRRNSLWSHATVRDDHAHEPFLSLDADARAGRRR